MADLGDSIRGDVRTTLERLLRKRLYVLMLRPIRPLDEDLAEQTAALLPAHFEWLFEQERQGRIFAAGPFLGEDEQSYTGEGMFIVRAGSLEEARELARGEPIIAHGLRTAEVRPWELNEGAISVRLSYSDGSFSID
ncbi:MAG TPA: YciI family protein [Candidatus Caenarcaniphilales bacterium]|nr:YciI family protein [Candidatus Caenarcaniphilales bacterium]